jgi:hypothetical protein
MKKEQRNWLLDELSLSEYIERRNKVSCPPRF